MAKSPLVVVSLHVFIPLLGWMGVVRFFMCCDSVLNGRRGSPPWKPATQRAHTQDSRTLHRRLCRVECTSVGRPSPWRFFPLDRWWVSMHRWPRSRATCLLVPSFFFYWSSELPYSHSFPTVDSGEGRSRELDPDGLDCETGPILPRDHDDDGPRFMYLILGEKRIPY